MDPVSRFNRKALATVALDIVLYTAGRDAIFCDSDSDQQKSLPLHLPHAVPAHNTEKNLEKIE